MPKRFLATRLVTRVRASLVVVWLALVSFANVSPAGAAPADDTFLRGYAAAVLERELRISVPSLRVQDAVVQIDAADLRGADRERVVRTLSAIRGVTRVEIVDAAARPAAPPPSVAAPPPGAPPAPTGRPPEAAPPSPPAGPPAPAGPAQPEPVVVPAQTAPPPPELHTGVMPGGQLFRPLIADPRWPHFAAAHHRYLDDPDFENVGAVSFGETFTIYRDRVLHGWWEVGIQAGVFAVFDLDAGSKDLINADYFVGVPLSYRYRDLTAMLRLFHVSSHVGDEFILRNRITNRVNLSYESVDAKLSYDFADWFRTYAGFGYLFDQEPETLRPWSTQFGFEFRSPWPDRAAGWRPIAATDIQHREENSWNTDFSLRAGLEFEGVFAARNMQLLLEYFRGNSPNGQFYKQKIDYLGLGVHFHF